MKKQKGMIQFQTMGLNRTLVQFGGQSFILEEEEDKKVIEGALTRVRLSLENQEDKKQKQLHKDKKLLNVVAFLMTLSIALVGIAPFSGVAFFSSSLFLIPAITIFPIILPIIVLIKQKFFDQNLRNKVKEIEGKEAILLEQLEALKTKNGRQKEEFINSTELECVTPIHTSMKSSRPYERVYKK